MPKNLRRYQQTQEGHFITFSCFRRLPLLRSARARDTFLRVLEKARRRFDFVVLGYVVMPEHVHLLVSEPGWGRLSAALQVLKQNSSRELRRRSGRRKAAQGELFAEPLPADHFWQRRYYDFNVRSAKKRIEKLKYMHRNPVKRGLVEKPEDWRWSSYRSYAFGEAGLVALNRWPGISLAVPA